MGKKQKKPEKTEKFYTISDKKLEEIKQNAEKEAMEKAFVLMLGFSVITLSDHIIDLWKVDVDGKRREERFTDYILDLWEVYQKGEIGIKDCIDCLKDECGLEITLEKINKIV